jgi:hypothetical protein
VGRNTRTRWEATAMPWIAGALAASERIYQSSLDVLPPAYSEHPSRPYMHKYADRVGDAELYWLSRTATAVVTDLAGHGMPPVTFRELIATSDLPASGLMLWPKPLAPLPWTNHRVQDPDAEAMTTGWDGLAWIYDDREFSTYLLSQVAEQRAAGVLSDMRPKWSPGQVVRFDSLALDSIPGSGETLVPINEPMDEFGAVLPSVSQVVAALLAIIGQERVVTERRMFGDRPADPVEPAGDRPGVVMLDVLRPPKGSSAARVGDTPERALRRWFVRGHWRMQPHGPGNTLRKLQYISLHTAGHPDAPEPTGRPGPQVRAVYGSKVTRRENRQS